MLKMFCFEHQNHVMLFKVLEEKKPKIQQALFFFFLKKPSLKNKKSLTLFIY